MNQLNLRPVTGLLVIAIALSHVCPMAAQSASQAPHSAGNFRIAGTVVNAISGAALGRTLIRIEDARNHETVRWSVTPDDGHFEFVGLTAGKYQLIGDKKGFMAAGYEQHEQFSTAIVTGSDLETEQLILRLAPLATISGRVLDESGEPVRDAPVSLYIEGRSQGVDSLHKMGFEVTDDQGSYEFSGLRAGSYLLAVAGKPWYAVHPSHVDVGDTNPAFSVDRSLDVAYPITYYKDTTDPEDALRILIRGGDHFETDIHLEPVQTLHVRFKAPENAQHFGLPALQTPSLDGMERVSGYDAEIVAPGVYEIAGLPAGRYTIRTPTSLPDGSVQEKELEMDLTLDGQELDATQGEAAASVKASITAQSTDQVPTGVLIALRNSKMRVVDSEMVGSNGQVEFHDVTPGRYEVIARAREGFYSITSISTRGKAIPGHSLDVTAGASLVVSMSVIRGSATVEGFVRREGRAAGGAMILLIPENPEMNRERFRRKQSDLDGSFDLRDVIPGMYTVCAIDDGWDLEWSSPVVIAKYCDHAPKVTVRDGKEGPVRLDASIEVHPK